MTVEDPIEYALDGISQTQVNTKIEMSFARGIAHHPAPGPGCGMIGEIRDLETAEIAVQASLTGASGICHTAYQRRGERRLTVLSTWESEPFLLASA